MNKLKSKIIELLNRFRAYVKTADFWTTLLVALSWLYAGSQYGKLQGADTVLDFMGCTESTPCYYIKKQELDEIINELSIIPEEDRPKFQPSEWGI